MFRWFRRRAAPDAHFSTGDPLDDELLRQIADRSPLDQPRHVIHFFECIDEAAVRALVEAAGADGWDVYWIQDPTDDHPAWSVALQRHDVVTSAAEVRATRLYFDGLAARIPGVEYDGWEGSI